MRTGASPTTTAFAPAKSPFALVFAALVVVQVGFLGGFVAALFGGFPFLGASAGGGGGGGTADAGAPGASAPPPLAAGGSENNDATLRRIEETVSRMANSISSLRDDVNKKVDEALETKSAKNNVSSGAKEDNRKPTVENNFEKKQRFARELAEAMRKMHGQATQTPSIVDAETSAVSCPRLLDAVRDGAVVDPQGGFGHYARTTTDPPVWISLHNETVDNVRWSIVQYGFYYEQELTKAVVQMLREEPKDALFVDVGGNVGWFSLISTALGHPTLTFEPNIINVLRFCQSRRLNGWETEESPRADLRLNGVGDVHGVSLPLASTASSNPGASTFRGADPGIQVQVGATVKIVTLDKVAEEMNWEKENVRIALMKVDVEGYEPEVFKGARGLLKSGRVRNIVFEFDRARNFRGNREDVAREMINTIFNSGYRLFKWGGWPGPSNDFKEGQASADELAGVLLRDCGKKMSGACNLWFKFNQSGDSASEQSQVRKTLRMRR